MKDRSYHALIGLVRKMQARDLKIVWVPEALVWHCQTVAKNATEKDFSRRFYNNGIALANGDFRKKIDLFSIINEDIKGCAYI